MTPLDLVKLHKQLYSPSARHPAIVEVPELAFLMLDGRGDPRTSEAYGDAVQGYELRGRHHEIYLGDPRRTAPERLKTVLRHPVRER